MTEQSTFHVGAPPGGSGRWTARAAQELVGRGVRYGKKGTVGEVLRAVPVDSGRALRLHVGLAKHLVNPDRRKFALAPVGKTPKAAKKPTL